MESIDFDEASKVWRSNKKVLPNGEFAYKCTHIYTTGSQCKSVAHSTVSSRYCKRHSVGKLQKDRKLFLTIA